MFSPKRWSKNWVARHKMRKIVDAIADDAGGNRDDPLTVFHNPRSRPISRLSGWATALVDLAIVSDSNLGAHGSAVEGRGRSVDYRI